jgi:predicted RNase H-like nuclease
MRAVLGIDAAWTLTQPSGVAVAVEKANAWHVIAAECSYQRFHARAAGQPKEARPSGSLPDASALLASASVLCSRPIDLVAIDMPLAHLPIVGRRVSDDAVSVAYGARQCGTHSPSTLRPSVISYALRNGFEQAGYSLRTEQIASPGLIEVYPHPALVELSGTTRRLPYKVSKARSYWPDVTPPERRARLYRQWGEIVALLKCQMVGVAAALPPLEPNASGWQVKAYEDALDAVVCAWVAISCLEGCAVPYGDANSAIWIPSGGRNGASAKNSRR